MSIVNVTQLSTASLGKFDKKLQNEEKVKLKRTSKRKFESTTGNAEQEKEAVLDIATKVLKRSAAGEGALNVRKAMKDMQRAPVFRGKGAKKARK